MPPGRFTVWLDHKSCSLTRSLLTNTGALWGQQAGALDRLLSSQPMSCRKHPFESMCFTKRPKPQSSNLRIAPLIRQTPDSDSRLTHAG